MASSCGSDADRSSLRQRYVGLRDAAAPADLAPHDELVALALRSFPLFREASLVLAYVSRANEVSTQGIIEGALAEGRRVALPGRDGRTDALAFFEVTGTDGPVRGETGVRGPQVDPGRRITTPEMVGSVCLVPGLVFDAQGHRIGADDGELDRFLAFYPGDKLGLARQMQLSSNPLPPDPADVGVDFLVTESGVWPCH